MPAWQGPGDTQLYHHTTKECIIVLQLIKCKKCTKRLRDRLGVISAQVWDGMSIFRYFPSWLLFFFVQPRIQSGQEAGSATLWGWVTNCQAILSAKDFYIIYNNWFTLPQGTPSAIWYHPNASWGQCVGTRRSGSMGNRPAHGEQSFWWLQCDTFHLWHDRKRYLVRIVWLRLWGARLRGNRKYNIKSW